MNRVTLYFVKEKVFFSVWPNSDHWRNEFSLQHTKLLYLFKFVLLNSQHAQRNLMTGIGKYLSYHKWQIENDNFFQLVRIVAFVESRARFEVEQSYIYDCAQTHLQTYKHIQMRPDMYLYHVTSSPRMVQLDYNVSW